MSVTSAMFTGVSGLLANAEGINVIGNNLANVNTVGFKDSRMLFSDMLSANIGNNSQIGKGTQIQKVDNLFSQGTFENTTSTTDLAIQGDSFFVLGNVPITTASSTAILPTTANLTRAGAFRLIADDTTADTYLLVNPDGYPVLDTAGIPICIESATAGSSVTISKIESDGTITATDATGTPATFVTASNVKIGTLAIGDKTQLTKLGGTLFRADAKAFAGGAPAAAVYTAANGSTEKILSNNLEQSTVDMAGQFVKMILTQRAYSANSKTITTADEMTQEALNLKR
ncbi:MAG: flagellar hook basal-body protein [Desulfuromonadaceae bacterium]|nr:flagellar hook basal-body protein [Desulfuromonadaceae bacterium]MDD5104032.1 flagellar hook basal-body protein [Desulfuromonadaceae bacterium]